MKEPITHVKGFRVRKNKKNIEKTIILQQYTPSGLSQHEAKNQLQISMMTH